jgi:hypothetical protein
MEFSSRKLKVAVIAVAVVLAFYLLYRSLFKTPEIRMPHAPRTVVYDANQNVSDSNLTQVGDVSIGTLQMARFSTLDPKTKQVQREFGFEKLLHQQGNQWEIEKPYMNIFRPDLTCYITASTGFVVVESDVSPPNPTDATLTGNVVAHIVPTPGSDVAEAFIYLDDLTFVAAQSRFFTAGPVTFTSDQARLQGAGLDMIYDNQKERLALLRIKKLEFLQFKVPKGYSLTKDSSASDAAQPQQTSSSAKPQSYTCVFSSNVIIDAGDQFVAADQVSISDIMWRARSTAAVAKSSQQPETAPAETPTKLPRPNQTVPANLVEVAVSCDNGIAVVPSDSMDALPKIDGFLTNAGPQPSLRAVEDQPGRTTFAAEKIDYSLATAQVRAPGVSKLTLYVRDVIDTADSNSALPLVITSNKMALFAPRQNRITFQGDCLCQMTRPQGDTLQQYSLVAPKLVVDLQSRNRSAKRALPDVAKITALSDGAGAKLSSVTTADDKFLSGIELKCPRFEYDADRQMFLANGPGVIKADNSRIPQPKKDVGRFSLQKPCYAVVRNFEKLKYFLQTERIVADNPTGRIYIDYFPITNNQTEQVAMTAGHIQADLVETSAGRYRLWTLLAKDGISLQDRGKLFEANELLYDDQKDLVIAKGSDAMPAYFNGVMFDGIEYNLSTEEVKKVEVKNLGFFNINQ